MKLGYALAGRNVSVFENGTVKMISPRFFSVVPDKTEHDVGSLRFCVLGCTVQTSNFLSFRGGPGLGALQFPTRLRSDSEIYDSDSKRKLLVFGAGSDLDFKPSSIWN